jgi:hypothetical protein
MTATEHLRPTRPRPVIFGGALSFTVVVVLLSPALPVRVAVAAVALIGFGWLLAGITRFVRVLGFPAILTLVMLGLLLGAAGGFAYWHDAPNRHAAAQIKELGAFYVGTSGTFLTGEVEYVYFDKTAEDTQVSQFTQLQGLSGLRRLVLKQTRITDATAQRFGELSGLRSLYLEGTGVSAATIEQLQRQLPACNIECR